MRQRTPRVGLTLKPSHIYRLVYKLQSGNGSWYKYEAIMTFLEINRRTLDLSFSLRPIAGTQTLPVEAILEAEDLGKTSGRNDNRHRGKKSLGRIPKVDD